MLLRVASGDLLFLADLACLAVPVQSNRGDCAPLGPILKRDLTTVAFNDPLCPGQPEPRLAASRFGAEKGVKGMGKHLLPQSGPIVDHLKLQSAISGVDLNAEFNMSGTF